jgi:transcriptional regulator with XRE-family HTH domain
MAMNESPTSFPRGGGNIGSTERHGPDEGVSDQVRQDPVIAELGACRQRLALTLAEVSERSGLPEAALRRWEAGDDSPPLGALHGWAGGLGLSLELVHPGNAANSGYSLDWDCRRLTVHGRPVRLTRMEWNILYRLAWSPGQLVTHRDLFRHLYGEDRQDRAQATAIRVRISKLRQRVPFRIEARWGQGYVVDGVEAPQPRSAPRQGDLDEIEPSPPPQEERCALPAQRRTIATEAMRLPFAVGRPERPPNVVPAAQALRMQEPVKRMPPPPAPVLPTSSAVRAEELGVIERFLAERGATRCPDPRMLAQAAVPSLIWDKMKRKWVRPAAEACGLGLTQ